MVYESYNGCYKLLHSVSITTIMMAALLCCCCCWLYLPLLSQPLMSTMYYTALVMSSACLNNIQLPAELLMTPPSSILIKVSKLVTLCQHHHYHDVHTGYWLYLALLQPAEYAQSAGHEQSCPPTGRGFPHLILHLPA